MRTVVRYREGCSGTWAWVRRAAGPLCGAACVAVVVLASQAGAQTVSSKQDLSKFDAPNPSGVQRTITLDGTPLSENGAFFRSLGTNGRSCASCHVPSTGWGITPDELQDRFDATDGLDPIFRTVDGSNSPLEKVNTVKQRRQAYSMLLSKGVIRVGLPIPANAEFALEKVDDPYGYASAKELSLFRRPLPSTNLLYLTAVMWDGRESFAPMGTAPISVTATQEQNLDTLIDDLMHQANDATTGHAQGNPIDNQTALDIVSFEMNLATAQVYDNAAGSLTAKGALGGPENLRNQPFYVTINDVLGADVMGVPFNPLAMTLYDAWAGANNDQRASIARGAALFGSKPIKIKNVGGLNDALGIKVIQGTCTTCHDAPNVGDHSTPLPIDIGITDASRRTPDEPLYTLRNLTTGEKRKTTDPGRALLTGKWADIGKFKGPILRGVAARAPYFHDGSAAELGDVLDFYSDRFNIDFTDQERADLIAFLNSL